MVRPIPAAVAGRQDREGENVRISWAIFGYIWIFEKIALEIYLEIWQDIIGDLWRSFWISLGIKGDVRISLEILRGDVIGYQLDNWRLSLLDIMWICKDIKRISYGYISWWDVLVGDQLDILGYLRISWLDIFLWRCRQRISRISKDIHRYPSTFFHLQPYPKRS